MGAVERLPQDDAAPLTEQMQRFVHLFTRGPDSGNGARCAKAAGYSEKTAPQQACYLLKLPHVAAAIDAALRDEIGGTLTAQAVAVMRRIINDEEAPLKLRGDIASRVVEYSGIVDRVRVEKARQTGLDGAGAGQKRLGELTREELEAVVRNGAGILAAAAALPPAGPTIDAQVSAQAPALPTQ